MHPGGAQYLETRRGLQTGIYSEARPIRHIVRHLLRGSGYASAYPSRQPRVCWMYSIFLVRTLGVPEGMLLWFNPATKATEVTDATP